MTPDILLVGHIVKDIVSDSWRPGGSIMFAAHQSKLLELEVGAVTGCSPDIDPYSVVPDVNWLTVPDSESVSFQNTYVAGRREQRVFGHASVLRLADIPESWRQAGLILLAPLFHDVDSALSGELSGPGRVIGCSAQGWLRNEEEGQVRAGVATSQPEWPECDVVFLSEEDVVNPSALENWQTTISTVVLTRSDRGCTIWTNGGRHDLPASPAQALDPTGAGDVFAVAFLIEYKATRDPLRAARFAGAAAALSVERSGLEGIGGYSEIETRLATEPTPIHE